MSPFSEKDLHFGITALQADFLRREQLVAAVEDWTKDRSCSLDEWLVRQGTLDAADRQLLLLLVERHIANHDGDVRKSLESLSGMNSLAEALRLLGNDEVDATLSLAQSSRMDAHEEATIDQHADPTPANRHLEYQDSDTRFRVLRSHAKGGLGEVFVAKDTELNREVALKEIQSRYADDVSSRLRFLLEAEVTGGLEHPGIVPVYGLGRYEDGRPFYAMRFIKGDSLKEAADRFHGTEATEIDRTDFESLEFRKLLGRFIDVCQAIEYAHSRGVLHRDLKPGNIMLGKYGETLVVDWGLAKAKESSEDGVSEEETTLRPASASGSHETEFGSAIGTPAFMPPEQAAGELDQLGPTSDVYSLGATLYYLLTGSAPFSNKQIIDLLQDVQAGCFPAPHSLQPVIPKSLSMICLKAMALRPVDRYVSPQSMADDVERFLADEAVSCCAEPVFVRARRWVRKHQTIAAATAAVVLVSIVGLSFFSSILGAKNVALNKLNTSLEEANTREVKARELAEENERTARTQSKLAFATLGSIINDIQDGLEDLPASGEIRRRLLATSLGKLESVASLYIDQARIDRQSMIAMQEMGRLVMSSGGGDLRAPTESAEQNSAVKLAMTFFERAREISTAIAEENTDPQCQIEAARPLLDLGLANLRIGNAREASKLCLESLQIYKNAIGEEYNPELQSGMFLGYELLGEVQIAMGDVNAAKQSFEKSIEIAQQLVQADTDAQLTQLYLVRAHDSLAGLYFQAGDSDTALKTLNDGVAIGSRLNEADPNNLTRQTAMMHCYLRYGDIQWFRNDLDEALVGYKQMLGFAEKLSTQNPHRIDFKDGLAVAYEKIATIRGFQEQPNESWIRKGLDLRKQLIEIDPNNVLYQMALSAIYDQLGSAELRSDRLDEALIAFEEARALRERLTENDPNNAQAQHALAISYSKLGTLYDQAEKWDQSLTQYQKSLAAFKRLATQDPGNSLLASGIPALHIKLAQLHEARGRWAEAAKEYRSAANETQQLIDAKRLHLPLAQALAMKVSLDASAEDAEFHAIALGDWDTLSEQPSAELPRLFEVRAIQFAHASRYDDAAKSARMLRDMEEIDSVYFYSAACVFGLCAASIETEAVESLTEDQLAQRNEWIQDAITALRKAINAGWDDFDKMRSDIELRVIRDNPGFKALIAK